MKPRHAKKPLTREYRKTMALMREVLTRDEPIEVVEARLAGKVGE